MQKGRHLSKEESEKAKELAEKILKDSLTLGVSDSCFAYAILILAHQMNEAGYHIVVPDKVKN